MKKLFARFCKENNIYELVIINKNIENRLKNFQSGNNLLRIFDENICWADTNQGFNFWYVIHMKWCIFLVQNGAIKKQSIHEFLSCRNSHDCSSIFQHYKQIFKCL